MSANFQQPSFASWPLTPAMKILLVWEERWSQCFSLPPDGLMLLLNTLLEQLNEVDYFINRVDTQQLFEFLRKLIESKPQDSEVLEKINNIISDIFEKIILKKRFNETEAKIPIYYLSLLKLMLEPSHRYLFEKPEITIDAKNFFNISMIPFHSSELLTQFRHALVASFQCKKFIKDYAILIRVISNLAKYIKKIGVENNELAAMQLFDSLGALTNILKNSPGLNQPRLEVAIQRQRRLIFKQFRPFVDNTLLKHSAYKFFLTQAYSHFDNLTQVCESSTYYRQCSSQYIRFKDSYRCADGQLAYSLIDIQNNNRSTMELDRLCTAMRGSELFASWMEEWGLKPNYNGSQYFLHLADSKRNFLIDKFLFERDDLSQGSYITLATYFPSKNSSQADLLLGATYTYTPKLSALIHEYIHHLSALYIDNLEFDLTLTEGIAELHSEGVCSIRNFRDLANYVNDTFIFEFFKARRFPFYFNALKWVAYLVNEEPELFKTLINLLQKEEKEDYYANVNTYIDNASHRHAFVMWSHQQVEICNDYLNLFPDVHQPPLIYLKDVKSFLNQTLSFNSATRVRKRDLLTHSDKAVYETVLTPYSYSKFETKARSQEFSQQMEMGIALPLGALFSGFTSSCLDDVGLAYRDQCPSLPAYINYGLKPFLFAVVSAGLNTLLFDQTMAIEEKIARLYTYFVMNFLSVLIAQPLTKKLAEQIQNKILCFFVPMLTWALLLNPSLFLSKDSHLFPMLCLQLIQGISFKLGEETYQLGKSVCSSSSFWQKERQPVTEDNSLNDSMNSQSDKDKIALKPRS